MSGQETVKFSTPEGERSVSFRVSYGEVRPYKDMPQIKFWRMDPKTLRIVGEPYWICSVCGRHIQFNAKVVENGRAGLIEVDKHDWEQELAASIGELERDDEGWRQYFTALYTPIVEREHPNWHPAVKRERVESQIRVKVDWGDEQLQYPTRLFSTEEQARDAQVKRWKNAHRKKLNDMPIDVFQQTKPMRVFLEVVEEAA